MSVAKHVIFGLALSLGAIAHAETTPKTTTTTTTSTSAVPDTQIAKILLTINDGEIDAAKVAKRQAQNKEVKDFASMMKDEHEKNMKETKKLAMDNKIKPEDSDASKALKDEAEKSNKDLKRQDKKAFDLAYMKQQVEMHEKALAKLRDELIPAAQNPDFKAHLEKTQAAVSEHLEHAKALQSKLE